MAELRPETVQRYLPRLRALLVRAAKKKRLVPYGDLQADLGIPRGWVIGKLLGALCEQEHEAGRPLLSAIVVLKRTQRPSEGFWRLPMLTPRSRWEVERDKVWNYPW